MKRLFSLMLMICMFMLNLGIHTDAYYYVPETAETQETVIEDKLSLYTLYEYANYDDLLDYAHQLEADELSLIDQYTRDMIIGISSKTRATLYHNLEFVSIKIAVDHAAIDSMEWDYRFRWIIQIYNKSRNEDLLWRAKGLENGNMQYIFESANCCRLQCPATKLGQKVKIISGSKYYESAWNDGTGKSGIATNSNPFIPKDFEVTVNGVAYYDSIERNHVTNVVFDDEKATQIDLTRPRMVHVRTENGDLGWFYPESLTIFWN